MTTIPPLPLQTIRQAAVELGIRVNGALRTQVGDVARLKAHRDECLRFMITVHEVSDTYKNTILTSLTCSSIQPSYHARRYLRSSRILNQ
jgi:hypothetical protein